MDDVPLRFYTLTETCKIVGLGRVAIWNLYRAGKFPQPVKVMGRKIGFVNHEVEAWIKDRVCERDDGKAA